jgi:hypothetical protein
MSAALLMRISHCGYPAIKLFHFANSSCASAKSEAPSPKLITFTPELLKSWKSVSANVPG